MSLYFLCAFVTACKLYSVRVTVQRAKNDAQLGGAAQASSVQPRLAWSALRRAYSASAHARTCGCTNLPSVDLKNPSNRLLSAVLGVATCASTPWVSRGSDSGGCGRLGGDKRTFLVLERLHNHLKLVQVLHQQRLGRLGLLVLFPEGRDLGSGRWR